MKKIILILLGLFAFISVKAQSWQTVFFDDFNRADGALGSNYEVLPSSGISQAGIFGNQIKIASDTISPSYCMVKYLPAVNFDSLRISCKFEAINTDYGFSIGARDNGTYVYRAGVMANTDSLGIFLSNYKTGVSITLAGTKANLNTTQANYLELKILGKNIICKLVAIGQTDTITISATDTVATGNNVNFGNYYFGPKLSMFIDDFKIETVNNAIGMNKITKNFYPIYPNPLNRNEALHIENMYAEDVNFSIYNATGQMINFGSVNKNGKSIDMQNLPTGVYILEIRSENAIDVQKFIVTD